ncbi:hypothetical protein CC78DRAFT_349935 [Lojkania enalia]|uniref:Uncharacterized protein n=1 Tax=Lojkania enalia TaxID=147567 RepID=A0A9P4K8Q4_9PLEO|nr:hypothetical protein CC78DRAFT_349935 [Didymosphaeria enalia]
MQLTKLASVVALAASASAYKCKPDQVNCDGSEPAAPGLGTARVFNRCPYTVYMWSIVTALGCSPDEAIVLKPGESYSEGFRLPEGDIGVSIKISKTKQCKGVDINQLEYFINNKSEAYSSNYLDVSYVDCQGMDCPASNDGFYLKSGNAGGMYAANDVNEICPILSCSSAAECSTMAYVLPDDRQTKSCNIAADLDFYMCGSEAPGAEEPEPASSSQQVESSTPEPTSTVASSSEIKVVQEAAITPAAEEKPKVYNVKTEVVYVTEVAYVNAKRHAHGHVHKRFHA